MKCPQCNKEFKETKYQRYRFKRKGRDVFCSKNCAHKHLSLIRRGENNPFYGKKQSPAHIEKFKKAVTKTGASFSNGYLRLNPKVGVREKPIPYHRFIMEKYIGRKLLSNEVVHHIDKNILNNSIDNLLLLTKSEHTRLHNAEPNRKRRSKKLS